MIVVAGVVGGQEQLARVYAGLRSAGIPCSAVRVIRGDAEAAYRSVPETGLEFPAAVTAGVAAGSALGGLEGGLAAAFGWLVVPESTEAMLAASLLAPLADELGAPVALGAGIGGLVSGLLGAHVAWRWTEARARLFRAGVARGASMIVVQVPDRRARARAIALLRQSGVEHIVCGVAGLADQERV